MEERHRKIITGIAFKLFRLWTKGANDYFPDLNFTIVDETKLVDDLEKAILKGIVALQNDDKKEKRKKQGFDYDFLISYLRGNLDTGWTHEYIHKNSELYRNYVACKSILEYLRFDTETGFRINNLYKGIMKNETNLAEISTKIDEKEIEKYELNIASKEKQYFEKQSPVYMYLENQLSKHVVDIMDSVNIDILPTLDSYFDLDFIKELILTYEK
jgi:hypothetical protein